MLGVIARGINALPCQKQKMQTAFEAAFDGLPVAGRDAGARRVAGERVGDQACWRPTFRASVPIDGAAR